RALAAVADLPYQTALSQVTAAAEDGRLPGRLDPDGMRQALDILIADTRTATAAAGNDLDLHPRYYRLHELPGVRLRATATADIDAARARGVAPAYSRGTYDPVGELGALGTADDNGELGADWWRRVVAAGVRADVALPCPYPPGAVPDGHLPIDH